MTPMEGTYDAKTKTLTYTLEEVDPKGNKMKGRDTIRMVDDDNQVQEMYRTPDGGKGADGVFPVERGLYVNPFFELMGSRI